MVRNVGLLSLTQSELSEYCRNCVTTVGSVVSELSDCVGPTAGTDRVDKRRSVSPDTAGFKLSGNDCRNCRTTVGL